MASKFLNNKGEMEALTNTDFVTIFRFQSHHSSKIRIEIELKPGLGLAYPACICVRCHTSTVQCMDPLFDSSEDNWSSLVSLFCYCDVIKSEK